MRDASAKECHIFLFIWIALLCTSCIRDREEESYRKAQQYWDQQLYGLAVEAYEQFVQRFPKSEKASLSLYKAATLCSVYLRDYPRASQLYLQFLSEYPSSALAKEARLNLAEIYEEDLGEYAKAISEYHSLLEAPNDTGTNRHKYWYRIGRCYFMMGDFDRALVMYKKIITQTPEDENSDKAAYHIGYIHYLKGNITEAEKDFRFFLKRFPKSSWTCDGMIHLARCYEKSHDNYKAQEIYRRVISQFPERTEVKDRLATVKHKEKHKKKRKARRP